MQISCFRSSMQNCNTCRPVFSVSRNTEMCAHLSYTACLLNFFRVSFSSTLKTMTHYTTCDGRHFSSCVGVGTTWLSRHPSYWNNVHLNEIELIPAYGHRASRTLARIGAQAYRAQQQTWPLTVRVELEQSEFPSQAMRVSARASRDRDATSSSSNASLAGSQRNRPTHRERCRCTDFPSKFCSSNSHHRTRAL